MADKIKDVLTRQTLGAFNNSLSNLQATTTWYGGRRFHLNGQNTKGDLSLNDIVKMAQEKTAKASLHDRIEIVRKLTQLDKQGNDQLKADHREEQHNQHFKGKIDHDQTIATILTIDPQSLSITETEIDELTHFTKEELPNKITQAAIGILQSISTKEKPQAKPPNTITLPKDLTNIAGTFSSSKFQTITSIEIEDSTKAKDFDALETVKKELLNSNQPYKPRLIKGHRSYTLLYLDIQGRIVEKNYIVNTRGLIVDRDIPGSNNLATGLDENNLKEKCLQIVNSAIIDINKKSQQTSKSALEDIREKSKHVNENWVICDSPDFPNLAIAVLLPDQDTVEIYTIRCTSRNVDSHGNDILLYQFGNITGTAQQIKDELTNKQLVRMTSGSSVATINLNLQSITSNYSIEEPFKMPKIEKIQGNDLHVIDNCKRKLMNENKPFNATLIEINDKGQKQYWCTYLDIFFGVVPLGPYNALKEEHALNLAEERISAAIKNANDWIASISNNARTSIREKLKSTKENWCICDSPDYPHMAIAVLNQAQDKLDFYPIVYIGGGFGKSLYKFGDFEGSLDQIEEHLKGKQLQILPQD